MGEAVMELGDRELAKIGEYVQNHLEEWGINRHIPEFKTNREIELLERMVRVEEGLKNIAEQMQKGFEYMEKRFEQVDKRFEQVDKRFEDMQHYMDRRFSQLQWTIGIGFSVITVFMGVLKFL